MDIRGRCNEIARLLMPSRFRDGPSVADVLRFALWGDAQEKSVPVRIWKDTQSPDWRLPHLGPNILGEMIACARPGESPPRNERVRPRRGRLRGGIRDLGR